MLNRQGIYDFWIFSSHRTILPGSIAFLLVNWLCKALMDWNWKINPKHLWILFQKYVLHKLTNESEVINYVSAAGLPFLGHGGWCHQYEHLSLESGTRKSNNPTSIDTSGKIAASTLVMMLLIATMVVRLTIIFSLTLREGPKWERENIMAEPVLQLPAQPKLHQLLQLPVQQEPILCRQAFHSPPLMWTSRISWMDLLTDARIPLQPLE